MQHLFEASGPRFIESSTEESKLSKPSLPGSNHLPIELCLVILAFLPPDTKLYPFLFVNSVFSTAAECFLYRNVSLRRGERAFKNQMAERFKHRRLFSFLAQTPRVSNLIRSINIPSFYSETLPIPVEYWEDLNCALRAMSNLKEVVFGGFAHYTIAPQFSAVLAGCTFRLRKISIESANWTGNDLKILQSDAVSGEVEELAIPFFVDGQFSAKSAFPKLVILERSYLPYEGSMPQLMGPGREIKALSVWRPNLSWPWRYPKLLSLRIGHWKCFDWSRLAVVFPSLRFLRIEGPYSPNWYSDLHDFQHLTQMTALHLPALIHLRKLTFGFGRKTTTALRDPFVQDVFGFIPQLELVCIGVNQWNRTQIKNGEHSSLCDDPDEWKDRKWWN